MALLLAPAVARADLSWSQPPQILSPEGTTSDNIHVATDAQDNAMAVWVQDDPATGHTRVAWALRAPGGGGRTARRPATPAWPGRCGPRAARSSRPRSCQSPTRTPPGRGWR